MMAAVEDLEVQFARLQEKVSSLSDDVNVLMPIATTAATLSLRYEQLAHRQDRIDAKLDQIAAKLDADRDFRETERKAQAEKGEANRKWRIGLMVTIALALLALIVSVGLQVAAAQ